MQVYNDGCSPCAVTLFSDWELFQVQICSVPLFSWYAMLTLEQRCKIAAWMEVLQSVTTVQRWSQALYGPHYAPVWNTILNTHSKFKENESVMDRPRSGRLWSGESEENVGAVREAFDLSQGKSIQRSSAELNISATSIQRILRRELRLFPYKIQFVQKLEPQNYDSCVEMCEILLDHFQRNPSILEQMWLSDDALFHLSGHVNRHNTRIRGLRNPVQIHEHERDTSKLIIWCAISSAGLIGPFFFRDQEGHSVNVNGDNYLSMLQEFLLHVANMQQAIFQQDGASAHYSHEVRAFLDEQIPDQWLVVVVPWNRFPIHLISHHVIFFLWDYIKPKVYETSAQDLPTLEEHMCFSDSQNAVRCWSGMREAVAWLLQKMWCWLMDEHYKSKMAPQIFSVNVDFTMWISSTLCFK